MVSPIKDLMKKTEAKEKADVKEKKAAAVKKTKSGVEKVKDKVKPTVKTAVKAKMNPEEKAARKKAAEEAKSEKMKAETKAKAEKKKADAVAKKLKTAAALAKKKVRELKLKDMAESESDRKVHEDSVHKLQAEKEAFKYQNDQARSKSHGEGRFRK